MPANKLCAWRVTNAIQLTASRALYCCPCSMRNCAVQMRRESGPQTLSATALVDEAWLRGGGSAPDELLLKLMSEDPDAAEIVNLHYFAGVIAR